MAWAEAAHPRNPKGPAGGEFTSSRGSSAKAKPAAKKPITTNSSSRHRASAAHGSMSFNGRTGTGYGSKHGDARVRQLQQALNRLGMTDAVGKRLVVDGKLGPKTTAAIKKWQKAHGMKADGVVTPAMLKQATARKTFAKKPGTVHKKTVFGAKKPMPMRRPPRAPTRQEMP